eukprot:scaffold320841_cov27-Tisochrysis_lutea.AAC.2
MRSAAALCLASAALAAAYTPAGRVGWREHAARSGQPHLLAGRRAALEGALLAGAALSLGGAPRSVSASGGATAGKYTTIPVAKRRYFGRVKQGVYEFLAMKAAVDAGNFKSPDVSNFFAQTIVTTSKRQKSNCRGSDSCTVQEELSSRWEDLQLSMFLLGNAFRLDSGKPPEKVRQVKEAKAFFSEVEKLQRAMRQGNKAEASKLYVAAQAALDVYLNDVELPPTFDPVYKESADMKVPSLCQGSFCV